MSIIFLVTLKYTWWCTKYFVHIVSSLSVQSVQPLSHFQLFVTPWTEARQASLYITNSRSLLKLMSIKSVMPSNRLILFRPILLVPSVFSSIRVFSSESVFCIRWPSIGVSASTSVLPVNIQDWFPLRWTGWISLQSKGLSRVFSITTVQKHQFFGTQLSLWSSSHIDTWLLKKTMVLTRWTFVGKVMSLVFCMLSWLVIAFLPRSKHFNFMAAVTICSDFGAPPK